MPNTIYVHELPEDTLCAEMEPTWENICRYWSMALQVATSVAAPSLHYFTWFPTGGLWCPASKGLYTLIPPPTHLAEKFVAAAGALICGNSFGRASRRLFGWPRRASGQIRLVGKSGESDWAGVTWAVGGRFGVDWFRLDLEFTEPEFVPEQTIEENPSS